MIDPHSFTGEHILEIRGREKRDPGLIERTIFALGLLEAAARSGLPFIRTPPHFRQKSRKHRKR